MYFFLKYIVTLFYKKFRIKIVCLLRESGPRFLQYPPSESAEPAGSFCLSHVICIAYITNIDYSQYLNFAE